MRYTGQRRRRLRRAKRACLGLLACFALWCAWGLWQSYHHPVIREWTVDLSQLDDPVRLAVLSDLHDMDLGGDNRRLAELTAAEKPDLILLDGDMLNSYSQDSGRVCSLVRRLADIAPVSYAWGNHELEYMERGTSPLEAELTAAGAEIIPDTCPDQPCWHYLKGKVGITESPKCAYYPRRRGINFMIRDLDTCIEAALTGEVK